MRNFPIKGLIAVAALSAAVAVGQTTSGDLTGTVQDATGAVIPAAVVNATNVATGVVYKANVVQGVIHLSNLPSGNYDIEGTAPGFSSLLLKGFRVDVGKTSTVNLVLPVASSSSTVEVTADAGIALDTTSANLTTTFTTQTLGVLPTATIGLGVINTSMLSPGVASSGGIGIGVGPSVGGQRPRNNNFTLEGIDNNDKSVTGPLVYVPNNAVSEFTLITNQFSPEFGHSTGGQFNTNIMSGTNAFHGQAYEYFQNRNLDAQNLPAGQTAPKARYDFNRYGGVLGGPIIKDKLFFFAGFERQTTGQNIQYKLCVPSTAGITAIQGIGGLNSTNVAQLAKYTPAVSTVDASVDAACFNQAAGPQTAAVYSGTANTGIVPYTDNNLGTVYGSGTRTDIGLGNYQVSAPVFTNFDALTTSMDWTISPKDNFRGRYIYNTEGTVDTAAYLPVFFQTLPYKYHLIALSEFHTFTPNLVNEARIGFNRYYNTTPSGAFSYPGLDSFPNLTFDDLGFNNYGPDSNAPQSTIQNMYQFTDNISYTKGKHTFKFGFDGRKFISPQSFTQRVRGDYEWDYLTEFLHDLAPTSFGQRSTGNFFYYGDQTAFYGYGNDTWRALPNLTFNIGLRYEFTSVPVGERAQSLNSAASVAGLVNFGAPQPQYKNFLPRFGVSYQPRPNTNIRAGFSMGVDVLFDNLGTLSFPPQYSSTNTVGIGATNPNPGDPGFLAGGGLPAGTGTLQTYPNTPDGLAAQRAATSAYLPNQTLPYAETWSASIEQVFAKNYTAEIRYVGTRGIHLPAQDQINIQPRVNGTNALPTYVGSTLLASGSAPTTLANIQALSNIVPAWNTAGFTSTITSYQPFAQSSYNGLSFNLTRRFQNGFYLNGSYTFSHNLDDATAEVFSTVLTPRRPQNSQNIAADYGKSALDHTHRLTIAAVYDLPYFKHSNYLMKNVVGNWEVSPIYTYESPEYATALSGVNSNLNGDSGTAIDRPIINKNGVAGTSSGVTAITNGAGDTIGYTATNPNAYYIQAGVGTLPTAARNTLPIRPIDNIDLTAIKRVNITEKVAFEFQAQAFNVINHPQYLPGSPNTANSTSYTAAYSFQTANGSKAFNHPELVFNPNARTMQLTGTIKF